MKPELSFKDISKFRFWSGIGLFFLYSFFFFNFIVLLLESIAYVKNIDTLTLIFNLPYYEYNFYIFFLAFYVNCFVSLMILELWYNKPAKSLQSKKARRFILYERKGFLNIFSLWLFRFIFILFIFHNASFLGCFPLYTEHKYLFFLLAIVLFSDLWIGFRRVYKVKWFYPLIFLFFIMTFSYTLTYIRPYNDKAKVELINKGYRYKNIQLPVLKSVSTKNRGHRYFDIYLTEENYVYLNKKEIDLEKLSIEIQNEKSETAQFFQNLSIISPGRDWMNVYIDKNVKMRDVKSFFKSILISGVRKVNIKVFKPKYDCDNKSTNIPYYLLAFDNSFYDIKINSYGLPLVRAPLPPPPPLIFSKDGAQMLIQYPKNKILDIKIDLENLTLNDTIISLEMLEEILIEINNAQKIITIRYNEEISFQRYLETYNAIRNSIYRQRDTLSFQLTGFYFLTLKDKKEWSYDKKKEKLEEDYRLIKETHPFKLVQKDIKVKQINGNK